MIETGKIINGDCIEVLKTFPESFIDLVVTSPPYNVGIQYDTHIDNTEMDDYWTWTEKWLVQIYRTLKDDGRVAINMPLEVNVQDRGGRVFFASEFYQIMKKVGFKFFGIVDLEEDSPHRSKTTAWGSWMSPSGPYLYNPKECVILATLPSDNCTKDAKYSFEAKQPLSELSRESISTNKTFSIIDKSVLSQISLGIHTPLKSLFSFIIIKKNAPIGRHLSGQGLEHYCAVPIPLKRCLLRSKGYVNLKQIID